MRQQQLQELEKNKQQLSNCKNHQFTYKGDDWICKNCGGKVSEIEKEWYELGKEHSLETPQKTEVPTEKKKKPIMIEKMEEKEDGVNVQ